MKRTAGRFLRKTTASVLKRFYILTSDGFSTGTAYGARFVFDWRHSLDKKVAVELYEREQIAYLRTHLDRLKPDMFVDIGSHAGLYSVIAKSDHPDLEIHAFEPDRTNLCQLYANLFVNGMQTNILVHEHGISDHDGKVSFDTSDATSSRGTRRISDTGNTEISVRQLDSVLTCSGKTVVVKIDVEGHECEAIEGAGHFLANNKCYLQVESAPEKFSTLNKRLTDLGYRHVHTCGDHYFTNMENA